VFIKNKTKVASRVGCSERAVLYFTELLFKSNEKKFSFRRVISNHAAIAGAVFAFGFLCLFVCNTFVC